jgi:hypothetical protein
MSNLFLEVHLNIAFLHILPTVFFYLNSSSSTPTLADTLGSPTPANLTLTVSNRPLTQPEAWYVKDPRPDLTL